MENQSVEHRAALSRSEAMSGGTQRLAKETSGKPKIERVAYQQIQMPALPLPDYETLFPKKRHGVMAQTRWDHIIAEVNQRRLEKALKSSGSESTASSHDELKVTCQPPESNPNFLAQQESLGEGSDNRTDHSSQKVIQPPKPILSDEKFDVSPKQALQPPKPVFLDKMVNPSTKQILQLTRPRKDVEVPFLTDHVSYSPSAEKSLKSPNSLVSALENAQKRNLLKTKPREMAGNEKAAVNVVNEPGHPNKEPETRAKGLPDATTNTAAVIKTQSDMQEVPRVKSRPTIPTRKAKKQVQIQQMVSNSDHQPSSPSHSILLENTSGLQDKVFEEDPFPTNQLFSHDPWQLPQGNLGDGIFLMKDPILNDSTWSSEPSKSEEISLSPPQVIKKKRQAPLPPVTLSSCSIKAKPDKHTAKSCEGSDVKTMEDVTGSKMENSVCCVNEQGNTDDVDISTAAFNNAEFDETTSKQQVDLVIKPNHSQATSAVQLPQASSGISKLALENAQKRNTDVNKTVATSKQSDTKLVNKDEHVQSVEITSKVTPTPQITPRRRRAPQTPVPSNSFSDKAKLESEVETKEGTFMENSCSSIYNQEQGNAENKDISTGIVSPSTNISMFPETSSQQQVGVEHSQTSQSQPKEPDATKQYEVRQFVIQPTTDILKEDKPKDSIEVEPKRNVSEPTEAQKDTTLKPALKAFPSSEIPLRDPCRIPEQTTDDSLFTDDGKTMNTIIDDGHLTKDEFPAQDVTIVDGSSKCLGNSGLSSDEHKSEADISPDAVLLKAAVATPPSKEPMQTEPLDTSLLAQPEAFQKEKAEEVITSDHKEAVMQPTEKMKKEIEVISVNDNQHGSLCQMESLEKVLDVDKENIIEPHPSSRDVLLSIGSRNVLQLDKNDEVLVHKTKEEVIIEETGLSLNDLDKNSHSDISLSPAISSKSHQDSLRHDIISTNVEAKPSTRKTNSNASNQVTGQWKEESLPSAITTTSVKGTLNDLSLRQQNKTSSIPCQTLISPPVDHLSPMSSQTIESMSKTGMKENSRGPESHVGKLESGHNTSQTPHSYESDHARSREGLCDTKGTSPSAPTMMTSDGPWERDSDESIICISTDPVTEHLQSGSARSLPQSKHENYIVRTISHSVQVPELHIASTNKGSNSAPEPQNWKSTSPREACVASLDPILEEDMPVVRAKEKQLGEYNFPTTFSSKSKSESVRAEQLGQFSPVSSGLKYARISPLEVPAVVPDDIGPPLASSPLRPHPVKPLSAKESQHSSIADVPEKIKVADTGPYTQLTQEELITLVVKQQTELTKRDEKILELEEYIDNLLVRVIDEKPSILMALAAAKGAH